MSANQEKIKTLIAQIEVAAKELQSTYQLGDPSIEVSVGEKYATLGTYMDGSWGLEEYYDGMEDDEAEDDENGPLSKAEFLQAKFAEIRWTTSADFPC